MVEAGNWPSTPRSFDELSNLVQQRHEFNFLTINCLGMNFVTRIYIKIDLYLSHWDTLEAPPDCQIVSYPERRRKVPSGKKPCPSSILTIIA